ncbi:MAG: DUF3341 domain-containing protein [Cytophagales bacterium]|nr:DUF3341 domain-containing protein [Cytophagales bacterium]
MSTDNKHFILGVFDDEDVLMHAIPEVRNAGVRIHEVYSPYPIHGIDDLLSYKRSKLPKAAFMFGFLGLSCAVTMMVWMLGFDWPMNIGGKPNIPLTDFVPISFECTVLFSAFGMVGTFLIASNLFPWSNPVIFDKRITDDKFVIAVDMGKNKLSKNEISNLLKSKGATEVNEKEI